MHVGVQWLALTFPDARMKRTLQARHAMISIAKGVVADHRRYMTAKAAEGGDAHAAPNGASLLPPVIRHLPVNLLIRFCDLLYGQSCFV